MSNNDSALEKLLKTSTMRRLLQKEYPRCKVYRGSLMDVDDNFFDQHPKYSLWKQYDRDSEIWIVKDRSRKNIIHIEEYIPQDIEIDANVWPFIMLKWVIYAVIVTMLALIFLK